MVCILRLNPGGFVSLVSFSWFGIPGFISFYISDVSFQISDFRLRIPYFRFQNSYFRSQISDVIFQISHFILLVVLDIVC